MDKDKRDEPQSLLGKPGPVKLGGTQKGDRHLFSTSGRTEYTAGIPYEEKKYVSDVIGEDYKVPTDIPSSVKSGATVAHMGARGVPPVPDTMPEAMRPEPERTTRDKWSPSVNPKARIDYGAIVRGNVRIEGNTCIAAGAIISGHEEEPIVIAPGCSIFEGALITILPVRTGGSKIAGRLVNVAGAELPVYVGDESVIAPGAQLTGPCYIGRGCLISMGAQVFWAKIGDGCVIEPGAFVMNVEIPPGYFVPAGMTITMRENVPKLPKITERYRFRELTQEMHAEIRNR